MKGSILYRPEVFQGRGRKEKYFEGWYFKCANKEGTFVIAIIPGIAYKEKEGHSFIQVCIPHMKETHYFRFSEDAFLYRTDTLYVQIEKNIFTDKYIYLDLENDKISLKGLIWFSEFVPAPITTYSPGIMGPFGLLSFLECYHGVVSMDHGLRGFLEMNNQCIHFEGGKGYIEKDWGTSFPKAYMWIQCNHFQRDGLSMMVSIAKIPLGCLAFRGFICAIAMNQKVRVFATYTGARISDLVIEKEWSEVTITQGKEKVVISVRVPEGHLLKAPIKGAMERDVYETLQGEVELKLYYKNKLKAHEKSQLSAYEISEGSMLL